MDPSLSKRWPLKLFKRDNGCLSGTVQTGKHSFGIPSITLKSNGYNKNLLVLLHVFPSGSKLSSVGHSHM